jgi:DNA polymerase-3 subunit epsilon
MPFPLFDQPLAIVDVETTGMSSQNGGVIDIGVLRIEHGQVTEAYSQLINPGVRIPAFITQLTGIENQDLEEAPSFADIASHLWDLLDGCIFIAHNVRFDYSFIKQEFKRTERRYAPKMLCTVKLSRSLYPQYVHHKLDALIERFNIPITDRHRAFSDAQATWQALQCMTEQASPELLEHSIKQQLRQPTLPPQLPKATMDALPQAPGVYIFYNDQGATLYVGKSTNIRTRVLSHFSDDVNTNKEMQLAQHTADIQTIVTTGELSALLKESQLIKQMVPIYNRMLRHKEELVLACLVEKEGYPAIALERHGQLKPEQIGQVMAVFPNVRQGREALRGLAKEYQLCHKLLGLQKTGSACFAHHLGTCQGACLAKEDRLVYQLKFDRAFAKLRLQRWPYPGPIMVTETLDDQSTSFILDQWCIVGTVDHQDQALHYQTNSNNFDLDQYKILRQFLAKPHQGTTIQLLEPHAITQYM